MKLKYADRAKIAARYAAYCRHSALPEPDSKATIALVTWLEGPGGYTLVAKATEQPGPGPTATGNPE